MAERRMFAKTIIDSDAFLEMPLSAQALYFHLSMRADDDGFINNPKKIQKIVGSSEDDLKLLCLKNFVIPFDSGIVVIKHWRIHNYIQKDRYKETVYQDEKQLLHIKDNKAYTLDTECIQVVSSMDTQVSIDKGKLDKIIDNPPYNPPKGETDEAFEEFWEAYPKKVGKKDARKAFDKAIKTVDLDTILQAIEVQKDSDQWSRDNGKYIPNPSTWLNQGRWDDELAPKGITVRNGRAVRDEAFWTRAAQGDIGL